MAVYRDDFSAKMCPRCASGLRTRQIGSAQLFECIACLGLFVPSLVLRELVARRNDEDAQAFLAALGGEEPPELDLIVSYVRCPDCATVMNRTQFAKGAKVIIDLCGCGVWFDPGEFAHVVRFVASGGLNKRALQIANERDKSKQAQRAGAPQIVRWESTRIAGVTTRSQTPFAPLNTVAVWSVFEEMVKTPKR